MAVSNDRRVRVDASKKQLAITRCLSSSGCGLAFRLAAVLSTSSRSSRLRSLIEMMFLRYSGLAMFTLLDSCPWRGAFQCNSNALDKKKPLNEGL
ncbi:hypothetical protein D3C75_1232720 [compost metagenome]